MCFSHLTRSSWQLGSSCMKLRTCWYLARKGLGGLSSLLLLFVLAPTTARATCGDHVIIGRQAASPVPSAAPSALRPEPMPPPNHPRPCSGPQCSRCPTVPDSVPAAPPSTVVQWLHVTTVLPFRQPQLMFDFCQDHAPRLPRQGLVIYHPPRYVPTSFAL